jgi:hypothetical protein
VLDGAKVLADHLGLDVADLEGWRNGDDELEELSAVSNTKFRPHRNMTARRPSDSSFRVCEDDQFLINVGQFSTTVNGTCVLRLVGTPMRNRSPSVDSVLMPGITILIPGGIWNNGVGSPASNVPSPPEHRRDVAPGNRKLRAGLRRPGC